MSPLDTVALDNQVLSILVKTQWRCAHECDVPSVSAATSGPIMAVRNRGPKAMRYFRCFSMNFSFCALLVLGGSCSTLPHPATLLCLLSASVIYPTPLTLLSSSVSLVISRLSRLRFCLFCVFLLFFFCLYLLHLSSPLLTRI